MRVAAAVAAKVPVLIKAPVELVAAAVAAAVIRKDLPELMV